MADLNNLLGSVSIDEEEQGIVSYNSTTANVTNASYDDEDNNNEGEGPHDRRGQGQRHHNDNDDAPTTASTTLASHEYQHLRDLWIQEIACPELLYHDEEIIIHHMEVLEKQEGIINDVMNHGVLKGRRSNNARIKRGGIEIGGGGGEGTDELDKMLTSLTVKMLRMECDRIRFILADLARVRLRKIERYPLHNREVLDRMSDEEVTYLQRYGQLIEKHLNRTVLAHLPKEHWRNLDSPEMIERPDINCYVFCRVNEDVIIKQSNVDQKKNDGKVNNDDNDDVIPGMSPDFAHEHKAGSTLIVRYQTIRELVRDGKVTMLT